jgi:hypothetical protein
MPGREPGGGTPLNRPGPKTSEGTAQTMATPPLGRMTWPVMKREASEAR